MTDQALSLPTMLFLQLMQAIRERDIPIPFDAIQLSGLIHDGLDLLEPCGDEENEKAEAAAFLALGFAHIRNELEAVADVYNQDTQQSGE